jgi:hypothetical protein
VIAHLGAEAGREGGPICEVMTEGICAYLRLLGERYISSPRDKIDSQNYAITTFSMLVVGALLSRATGRVNRRLSKRIVGALVAAF